MRIEEFCRNLIQISDTVYFLYNLFCATPVYKKIIAKKIKNRLEYLKNRNEIKFMIETTSVCNAKCVFCVYPTMKRKHAAMSDETFSTIVERIKTEDITPLCFDLFMIGEPFLDKKIFERIRILKTTFPNAKVNITSNFSSVDKDVIDQLIASKTDFVNISLNASDGRKYKAVMGLDYEKTVENVKLLIAERDRNKSDLRIGVSMVVYDDTSMKDVWKFFAKWAFKTDTLRFQRAATWGSKVKVKKLMSRMSFKNLYPCNELFERFPILSNGDFALCCQDAEGIVKLNVHETPVLTAWHSAVFEKMREINLGDELRSSDMCKDCFATNSNGANWLFPH